MMPRNKKVKIRWIILGILFLLGLCACGGIVIIALIATSDTKGLEEKKTQIKIKYERFGQIATNLDKSDTESLRACRIDDIEGRDVLDMNYIDLEYMKTLSTKEMDKDWGFLNGNEFRNLDILDDISYNAVANNVTRSIENIENDELILVIDDYIKSLPERVEDTDIFDSGYFMGEVIVIDLHDSDKAICKTYLVFESSENVLDEENLLNDFEEQFKASLVKAFE